MKECGNSFGDGNLFLWEHPGRCRQQHCVACNQVGHSNREQSNQTDFGWYIGYWLFLAPNYHYYIAVWKSTIGRPLLWENFVELSVFILHNIPTFFLKIMVVYYSIFHMPLQNYFQNKIPPLMFPLSGFIWLSTIPFVLTLCTLQIQGASAKPTIAVFVVF